MWTELVSRNPENYTYFCGLECCALNQFDQVSSFTHLQLPSTELALTEEQRSTLESLYAALREKYPRSNAIQFIQLHLLEGDAFSDLCKTMTVRAIRKGIPSFFNTLETVFAHHPEKVGEGVSFDV